VRAVEWSANAERQLASWIDHLADATGLDVAKRANDEARRKATSLARFAGYRPSRWAGYQELSLQDWHKTMVFRTTSNRVIIAAIYDMRQDLRAVSPQPE
jgi:plasmid stabilization system protein ParE